MQVCGILVGNKVDEIERNVFKVSSRINSTWGGNLVDMVRSSQILQIIEEDQLCENAALVGSYLKEELSALAGKFGQMTNIRGKGLMCAFDFSDKEMRDAFLKKGIEKNVMFLGCGNRTIRFRPALSMEKKHIDEGLNVMEEILSGF
jgi:L-lysine 6-transaminase